MELHVQDGYSSFDRWKFSWQFRQILKTIHPLLETKLGLEKASHFTWAVTRHYSEEVLPSIPYIGGSKNPFSGYLTLAAAALAIYRTLRKMGCEFETSAEIIYQGMMHVTAKIPRFVMRLFGLWSNSSLRYSHWKRAAEQSKRRRYPFDWVFSYVSGAGESFDYGIDMHECGIQKYLRAEGASELTTYLCAVDYITHAAMGVELRRTKTIDMGCDSCDFRFLRHGQPHPPSWPPHFPEKDCRT